MTPPSLRETAPSRLVTVCPDCHGSVERVAGDGGLRCRGCGATYPRRAAVDVFLTEEEWRAWLSHRESHDPGLGKYERARRDSPLNILYNDQWVSWMFGELPDTCRGALLEMMCGGAEICRRLPARFSAALAMDVNVPSLERAARELEAAGEHRVRVVAASADRVPLAAETVDVVMIQGGLHHTRPLLGRTLREIHRVLRPGGMMVASEPANDHWLTRAIRHWQYAHSHLQGDDEGEDGFTRQEIATACASAGLRLERYRQFGFVAYPFIGNTDIIPLLSTSRWMGLGRALLALDRALERVPIVRGMAWASIWRAVKA